MKVTCNKNDPPLGGYFAAYLYKSVKNPLEICWGTSSEVVLPKNSKDIKFETSNDLIRILEKVFNKEENPVLGVVVNHWLTFCLNLEHDLQNAIVYLDKILGPSTYLVGQSLSVADLAVFSILHVSSKYAVISKSNSPKNVARWMKLVYAQPSVVEALKNLPAEVLGNVTKNNATATRSTEAQYKRDTPISGRLQEGKFVELPNAEIGKVVVRFPPEASGYLHIGHAKAALLNQYYQLAFEGKLIMRFDDTNPAKENVEFEKVILGDVEMLEIKPDMFTHTSQYFDLMLQYCEKLIKEGKAFVDDTPAEQMKNERDQKAESKNRSNSVDKNMQLWKEMQAGSERGVQCCVRAKIDMQSTNGCLRDPTIYRCKPEPHPRTGTQYKVYPTYDFACPIVDSIEGVTHVLRTMEYHDRDPQFYWFIDALGIRKPYIWEYSRLSMTNTVLSKRKLTWFVEQGLVDGWDDPRMPTVRGVLRRGMTVEGLRQFIQAQGSSRSVVFMEWDKIWAINKKVIDPIAPRYTALESNPVPVNLSGISADSTLTVALHPKNPDIGDKTVWVSNRLLVDQVDAKALKEGENATFINYGNVIINKIHRSKDGTVTSIDGTPNLDNKDYKKTLKLTWLAETSQSPFVETYCVYFDHIISKGVLGKDEDFKQYIGHQTRWEVSMLGEPQLSKVKVGDIIQLQRRGFFRVDVVAAPPSLVSGKPTPLILFHVPDGHTKEMPGQGKPAPAVAAAKGTPKKATNPTVNGSVDKETVLAEEVTKQGDLVRELKTKKADKATIDAAVKKLLELKASYKSETGKDYAPSAQPTKKDSKSTAGGEDKESALAAEVSKQGDLVRELKTKKADKATIDAAVKKLLELKASYKSETGKDYAPSAQPTKKDSKSTAGGEDKESALAAEVSKQGDLVRELKTKKADKATIDAAVKKLLELKASYKSETGKDYAPSAQPAKKDSKPAAMTGNSKEGDLAAEVAKQGDLVRELKTKKADKATIDAAVKRLLELKANYKSVTGKDYVPPQPSKNESKPVALAGNDKEAALSAEVAKQGDLVRELKSKKADKATVDAAVKRLLELKASYKSETGKDYTPSAQPATKDVKPVAVAGNDKEATLAAEVTKQGDVVRDLKSKKADKATIDAAVKRLLELKASYKSETGKDYTPSAQPTTKDVKPVAVAGNDKEATLAAEVTKQGDVVRDLKSKKADKASIDAAVKRLLELKASYKSETGKDYAPSAQPAKATEKKESKPKEAKPKESKPKEKKPKEQSPKPAKEESAGGIKKITRLGLEAKKDSDLPEWYSQVITKSEMIEYYDISGCYILRPWSYAIWDHIRDFLSVEFKKLGVKDCYFPIFVSKAALEREQSHIADFAPEVAWVTHSGQSELAEHIAVRPTSETVMYPSFAKWIQSHRDLPLKLNQWNNVVRWEFKQPQPFIRTREFLWQEGHTAFLTQAEADQEVLQILDLYAKVYEELLAIPVMRGRKTEKEKFAGGDYTTTVEAYVPASGRGIQGATSHHLGQNFSKMFDIIYDDPETQEKKYVYQNSWGLTTRTIGVMILVHGDDRGLVLPPAVASVQVIVVPCGMTAASSVQDRDALSLCCQGLVTDLTDAGVRAEGDYRDNYSPGWKFNHWELKGVPIRVEIGPKDMSKGEIMTVTRLTGDKTSMKRDSAVSDLKKLLLDIHQKMLTRATQERDSRLSQVSEWTDFTTALEQKHVLLAPFCGEMPCEDNIKNDSARLDEDNSTEVKAPAMGAKSLCIPFQQPRDIKSSDKCIHPACNNAPKFFTLFGRSY